MTTTMTMPELGWLAAWAAPMIDVGLRGALLLAVAAAVALGLGHRSAALRARVWILALGALLALPLVHRAMPTFEVSTAWPGTTTRGAEPTAPPVADPMPALEASPVPSPMATSAAPGALAAPRPPADPVVAREGGARRLQAADAPALLVLAWLAGAVFLVGRVVVGLMGAAVRAARGRDVADRRIVRLADRATAALGMNRTPRLVWSDEAPVPMTSGLVGAVVLLPAAARHWDDDRLLHVLLHEFAHVVRRDTLQGVLADVARAVHWPDPLVWLAAARYRHERERACDDRVLEAGCRPSDYAGHLLGVAAGLRDDWRPLAGVVPMARPGELPGRIGAILDPARRRNRPGTGGEAAALLAALAVVAPLAAFAPTRAAAAAPAQDPAVAPTATADPAPAPRPAAAPVAPLCSTEAEGRRSTRIDSDRRSTRIEWEVGDCLVEVDIRGDIEFGDDDRSIVSMGSDARFEIDEDDAGTTRRLRLDGTGGGDFSARFWIDGDEHPFEPDGREWLAEILPELFRETTLDAEARVERILARGGVDGVLAEIETMRSDHVIGTYYTLLASRESLSVEQTRRVLEIAADRVESDHYRHEMLMGVLDSRGLPPSLRTPFLAAAADIESDHYKAETLGEALAREDLDSRTVEAVLATAAADIESDHYLAEILLGLVDEAPLSAAGRGAFLQALESVGSDHYRTSVLQAFLDVGGLTPDEVADILDLSRLVESDHYRAELLQRVADHHALDGAPRTAFLRSAAGIESDHYVRETAMAVLEAGGLEGEDVGLVLDLAAGVDSDHHRAGILLALADAAELEGADRERFVDLARAIGSRHYRDQVLAAVVR